MAKARKLAKKASARLKAGKAKPAKKAAKKSVAKRSAKAGSKSMAKRATRKKAPARKTAKSGARTAARRSTPAPMSSPTAVPKRKEEMPGMARGTVFEKKPKPAPRTHEERIPPARDDTSRRDTRPAAPYADEPDVAPDESAPDLPRREDSGASKERPGVSDDQDTEVTPDDVQDMPSREDPEKRNERPGLPDDDEPETDPDDPWKPRTRE